MDLSVRNALRKYRRTIIDLSAEYLDASKPFDHRSACKASLAEIEDRLRESGYEAPRARIAAERLAEGERKFAFATMTAMLYEDDLRKRSENEPNH